MKSNSTTGKGDRRIVTFRLGKEIYGVDIFKVQEVIHNRQVVSIPNSPPFVEGIIQVRERIIPVVDLKKRLSINHDGRGEKKRILILELEERALGVIVDDISRVMSLDEEMIESLPESVIDDRNTNCIKKLAKSRAGLIIVLSPEHILSTKELEQLEEMDISSKEDKDAATA